MLTVQKITRSTIGGAQYINRLHPKIREKIQQARNNNLTTMRHGVLYYIQKANQIQQQRQIMNNGNTGVFCYCMVRNIAQNLPIVQM